MEVGHPDSRRAGGGLHIARQLLGNKPGPFIGVEFTLSN